MGDLMTLDGDKCKNKKWRVKTRDVRGRVVHHSPQTCWLISQTVADWSSEQQVSPDKLCGASAALRSDLLTEKQSEIRSIHSCV